jgi:hypothetical protein
MAEATGGLTHTCGKNSKGGGRVRGTSIKIMESLGELVQAW